MEETSRKPKFSKPKTIEGGSGVIFACKIEMKVPITGISTLFTEKRYLAIREKYCNLNFWASILSYYKML